MVRLLPPHSSFDGIDRILSDELRNQMMDKPYYTTFLFLKLHLDTHLSGNVISAVQLPLLPCLREAIYERGKEKGGGDERL